jgi:ABC-type Na+ transport system ATPase subunit NatA
MNEELSNNELKKKTVKEKTQNFFEVFDLKENTNKQLNELKENTNKRMKLRRLSKI